MTVITTTCDHDHDHDFLFFEILKLVSKTFSHDSLWQFRARSCLVVYFLFLWLFKLVIDIWALWHFFEYLNNFCLSFSFFFYLFLGFIEISHYSHFSHDMWILSFIYIEKCQFMGCFSVFFSFEFQSLAWLCLINNFSLQRYLNCRNFFFVLPRFIWWWKGQFLMGNSELNIDRIYDFAGDWTEVLKWL